VGMAKIQMDWVGLADMHMLSDASRVLKSVISKLQQVRKVFCKKYFASVEILLESISKLQNKNNF